MAKTNLERVLALASDHGVIRPRDLSAHNIPREYLARLHAKGLLDRPARGVYVPTDVELGEHQSLVEASKRISHGIICLLSALRFHDLTTQAPFEVWMAISIKARLPRMDYPPIRFVRFSGLALTSGIENHTIQGVPVRVTSPARTVADCFKYRNKIGLDVALEALRDCWRKKKASMDQLHGAAKICRMANVMRPYLESLT